MRKCPGILQTSINIPKTLLGNYFLLFSIWLKDRQLHRHVFVDFDGIFFQLLQKKSPSLYKISRFRIQDSWELVMSLLFILLTSYGSTGCQVFKPGGTKLERFLPMNQQTQRELLNFENRCSG